MIILQFILNIKDIWVYFPEHLHTTFIFIKIAKRIRNIESCLLTDENFQMIVNQK